MYCSKCGADVGNEAQFCYKCGSPIHDNPSVEGNAQASLNIPPYKPPAKATSFKFGWPILGLFGFALLGMYINIIGSGLDSRPLSPSIAAVYTFFWRCFTFYSLWKRLNRNGWVGAAVGFVVLELVIFAADIIKTHGS